VSFREVRIENGFDQFRGLARQFLAAGIAPGGLTFLDRDQASEPDLFASLLDSSPIETAAEIPKSFKMTVPPAYMKIAEAVAHHSSPQKWNLLYRLLWRLQHENRRLLEIAIDDDVREATLLEKAVRREIHKVHAFVRFEKIPADEMGPERFLAWIETDHPVIELAAPFFARRFGDKPWSILTPHGSAFYDGENLTYGEPVLAAPARTEMMDDLWKAYYRSSFNPARIKIKAMRAEMPLKYWKALPETEIISELIRNAPERLNKMAERQNKRAHPPESQDLSEILAAAKRCDACPLYEKATQLVFGEGPRNARVMIIGEQPGEQEDLSGRPFVGPAGEVFNRAMDRTGFDRREVYVTNSVKHFKWKPGPPGKPRLHQKPSGSEMHACRPWVEKEIEIVKPHVIVCMGATAATVLLGRVVKLADEIGKVHTTLPWAPNVLITYHPSAILRAMTEESKQNMLESLESTLAAAQTIAAKKMADSEESAIK
jgi:probable DNA metabolism protein